VVPDGSEEAPRTVRQRIDPATATGRRAGTSRRAPRCVSPGFSRGWTIWGRPGRLRTHKVHR